MTADAKAIAKHAAEVDTTYTATLQRIDATLTNYGDAIVFGPPSAPRTYPPPVVNQSPDGHNRPSSPSAASTFVVFNEVGVSSTGQYLRTSGGYVIHLLTAPNQVSRLVASSVGLKQAMRDAAVHRGDWITIVRLPNLPGSAQWQFEVSRPKPPAWAVTP